MNRQAICIVRKYESAEGLRYWGTVRVNTLPKDKDLYFSYDTTFFDTSKEAKVECKAFCKWKNLRIGKWIEEVKNA